MNKSVLTDKYGRTLNYLRLSVTDRCNFRCYYCMPEEGMRFASRSDLLTFDELYALSRLFCEMGVTKIRITGGEPFVRAGIVPFLKNLRSIPQLEEISITSNGTLIRQTIPALQDMGIRAINISLDTLDRKRFYEITRRDRFDEVFETVLTLLEKGFDVKLNCVLSAGKNTEDIIPFVELTKQYALSVRFLEEMPFNGGEMFDAANWNYKDIYGHIAGHYDVVEALPNGPNSTSVNYRIPGYAGSFGIIPSYSRTFCGTCNRIRVSATGELRTCLYGVPAANLRAMMRNRGSYGELTDGIAAAVAMRKRDGYAAEAANTAITHESMSVLGG